MIVISDTSPLSALAELGLLEILPALHGNVVIPESVALEARHPKAPEALRTWMTSLPRWITIVPDPKTVPPEVSNLDAGEAAAIALALESRTTSLLILDDSAARLACESLTLSIVGTAGLLLDAANAGLIDFHDALERLRKTTFRLSPRVIEALTRKLK